MNSLTSRLVAVVNRRRATGMFSLNSLKGTAMELLDEINAHIAESAIEAGHLATIDNLKKKYKATVIKQEQAAGKTVNRVLKGYDSIVMVFDDNTILYATFDSGSGYSDPADVIFIHPELVFFEQQGLMSTEDRAELEIARAFFDDRSQAAEDQKLLHQVKSRFGPDKLKELFT